MSETVEEWKARKQAQALRLIEKYPEWKIESWQDHGTKFVLVHEGQLGAIIIGQLPRNENGQHSINSSDEEAARHIEAHHTDHHERLKRFREAAGRST